MLAAFHKMELQLCQCMRGTPCKQISTQDGVAALSRWSVSLRTSWNQFTLINKLDIGPDVLMLLFHKTEGTATISFYVL
jgi:hypothetical protein